ncbi:MAG: pilin [Patescibacteria group bacterium]
MNKIKVIIFILILLASLSALFFLLADVTLANSVSDLLEKAAGAGQYDTSQTSLAALVGKIIRAFLSLLGVIFIGLMIYGGFLWMNSRGDAEQVRKAQDIIKDSIIGLVIIVAAYAITYFVLHYIAQPYTKESGF